jgi:hypothetical protein
MQLSVSGWGFPTILSKMPVIPDHSEQDASYAKHSLEYSVNGNVQEEIPSDMPEAKGQPVRLTCFWDANLMHDLTAGRSCTGVLHMINKLLPAGARSDSQQLRLPPTDLSSLLEGQLRNR